MSWQEESEKIASTIQNSAIANDPRVRRTGKDAAGMTAAFDASIAKYEAEARETFAGNKAALSAYLRSQAESVPATRESIRKYEISQVADWASKKSMRNVDDMYQKFSDWSTLEVARIESEYGIAVESAKVASKAIYDEKVRMFGEGMLFSDKDNKVKVTTREECERIAKSAMEDKARLIIEGAESNRANGYSVICGNLQSLGENAHKMMIADGRSMFMSEEDAALNASSYIGKKSNELIDSYSGSGYSVLAKMLLEKYSQAGITDVYETEKNDDGSIKIDKKTGTPVFKLDAKGKPIVSKTEYNPSRRLWMSMSDLKSIRSKYDKIISDEAMRSKNIAAQSEDAAIAAINMSGANGDAILSSPDYVYNETELAKEIGELTKQMEYGAKIGSKKITEAAQENLRRLRTKAQTMTSHRIEIEDKLTKRISDESGAEIWEDYQTEMAQWNNDVVGEIVTSVMTVDASGKKMMSAQSIDQRFYLKKMCERLAHDERLNPQQREQVKADLADLNNKMDKRYAINATKLLRNVGFVIPDEQIRYVADRSAGEYAGLDGAPTGQWSDFVLVGENGKPDLGNSVTVDWVMPNSKKIVERPWFLPNSESQVEIKGLKRTELQYIAQEAVKKLKSLEYDPYDGKHEEERLDIERSIIDKIGLLAEGKNKAAVFDGMIDAIGKAETFRQVNNGSYVGQRMTGGFFGKIMLPSEERQQERLLELSKRNQKSEK